MKQATIFFFHFLFFGSLLCLNSTGKTSWHKDQKHQGTKAQGTD